MKTLSWVNISGTVTVVGTGTIAGWLLASLIVASPAGASPVNVAKRLTTLPPSTELGSTLTDNSFAWGPGVGVGDFVGDGPDELVVLSHPKRSKQKMPHTDNRVIHAPAFLGGGVPC